MRNFNLINITASIGDKVVVLADMFQVMPGRARCRWSRLLKTASSLALSQAVPTQSPQSPLQAVKKVSLRCAKFLDHFKSMKESNGYSRPTEHLKPN